MADEIAEGSASAAEGRGSGRGQRRRLRAAMPRRLKAVPAPAGDEANKVVHIVQRLQEDASRQLQRKRSFWLPVSLLASIVVPTLLAALYYGLIAADQYVSEARFAVRSNEAQAADVLGLVTGMPRATVVSDSYIVTDYITSREMVEDLEARLPLREIYSRPEADFLTRLDPAVTIEGLVDYWNRRLDVFFDPSKNTVTVRVQAFVSEDAEKIAVAIIDTARSLVNELSAQSRRDAVQFAATEVARAELRVRAARDRMQEFRSENRQFDPAATAQASAALIGQLESQRTALNSQLAALSGYMSAEAPSMQMLQSRIESLDSEINRIRDEVAAGVPEGEEASGNLPDSGPLVGIVAEYQELLLDQQFAETAYTAALGSLERARTEADRTQSYLAIYVSPSIAQDATYPRRVFSVFVVLLISFVAWAIGALAVLTIRDHIR